MTRLSKVLIAAAAMIAVPTHSAFAQDDAAPAEGEPAPDPGTETPADPATDPAATPDPNAAPVDPDAPTRWVRDIVNRVLTLPKGLAVVGVDLATPTSSFFDPAFIRVLAGYGITDDLELAFAHYAFPTSDVGKGSIDFQVGYKLARGAAGGKLEVIGRAQAGYSLASEGLNPLGLGVHAQYNLSPKMAVITPGGQLQIALDGDPKPITFGLPVSFGYQVTPTLYLQVDTTLATFNISNSANAFIFADTTPLFLGAYFNAMPALDVIAGFGLNLTPPDTIDPISMMTTSSSVGDTMSILVGARYYIGKL